MKPSLSMISAVVMLAAALSSTLTDESRALAGRRIDHADRHAAAPAPAPAPAATPAPAPEPAAVEPREHAPGHRWPGSVHETGALRGLHFLRG